MVIGAVLAAILPAKVAGEVTDCAAFDCQVWAQSVYVLDRPGYGALDPDASGGACEELSPGAAPALWSDQVPAGAVPATFSRITDGDTIRVVANGREEPVRLILIDTPETHDPNDPAECYGQEATASTTWLFSLGGQHYLESDVTDQDRYDRLLRYAWLDLGDGEVYLVNETVVRAGYGALSTYPPDVKYVDQIRAANAFAREHGYGLWSACQSDAEGDTNELGGGQAPPVPAPEQQIISDPGTAFGCDPNYPDACIPPAPPDLDRGDPSPFHGAAARSAQR
jgi:endonuclease YncB( thermonuclease family)